MMRRLPPLASLRTFEAAARQESFKKAASELGVTATAVSHQIRQLEAYLEVSLFERQTRKVRLTVEGRSLYPALRAALDTMAEAVETVRKRPRRRIATLSATVAFTAKLLVPRVGTLRSLHPGWDLRLHASDDTVDLNAGDADAAIRYGLGHYAGMIALPLLTDRFAPVCSPRLPVRELADLPSATLLHFDWGPIASTVDVPNWRSWARRAGIEHLDPDSGVSFNDESSAIQAAIAGQGVALLSLSLVADELASGALVQPFGPIMEGLKFSFVYPEGAENRPAVGVLKDWVLTEFAERASRLPTPDSKTAVTSGHSG
ncbi:transcriptional regulator GcvA [Labrys sp. KNU-23]|uniref:transcriptional regulator GcvA n=1 Tax=Labrys sp. KNU-23 TaxID=2789216 RepID=UPI001FF05978|nr:transcriptional regulator GcvA [Labrys sp. KNU-23]